MWTMNWEGHGRKSLWHICLNRICETMKNLSGWPVLKLILKPKTSEKGTVLLSTTSWSIKLSCHTRYISFWNLYLWMQLYWVTYTNIHWYLQMYKATSCLLLLCAKGCFLHSQHVTDWVKVICFTVLLAYFLLHKFIPIIDRKWPEFMKQSCQILIQRNKEILVLFLNLAYL